LRASIRGRRQPDGRILLLDYGDSAVTVIPTADIQTERGGQLRRPYRMFASEPKDAPATVVAPRALANST
jgi:hypothetical protein